MYRLFKRGSCGAAVLLILFIVSCTPSAAEPGLPPEPAYPSSRAATPEIINQSAYPAPTVPIAATPEPTPTEPPTPTIQPLLTPIPTPIATPIPTVAPPIIPEVVGKAQQRFWIYYWQDNEVWRIDDQGQNREMLLDTYEILGQWLTEIPDLFSDSDCCWTGPRVVVSPDGQKLALVVVDKIKLRDKDDPFTFSIYVLDVQSRDLKLVSEGVRPLWSSDEKRIAFIREGGLWIADLESGSMHERVTKNEEQGTSITEFVWSPDGTKIAYLYNFGMHRIPTIWLIDANGKTVPHQLLSVDQEWEIYRLEWSPNGQRIFYLSQEGSKDISSYHRVENLWSFSLIKNERTQLTQDIQVQSYGNLPGDRWLILAGYHLYEQSQENYDRDLWLLSLDGETLRRITANQGDYGFAGWSPDNTRLIIRRAETDPLLFSLDDGKPTVLSFDLGSGFQVGGSK